MTEQPLAVAVIGAAVSANKGAASMFFGLLDGLADAGIRADVNLLTTYRDRDEAALQRATERMIPEGFNVSTVDAGPVSLVLAFVLALPIRLLDRLHLGIGPLRRVPLIRAVRDTAVTVDLAGISFADGRSPALLGYNVIMSLFPYLAGAKVVKGSQAIGPVENFLTRLAASCVASHDHDLLSWRGHPQASRFARARECRGCGRSRLLDARVGSAGAHAD